MNNKEIAEIFYQIAEILEIQGENRFRIRAYQKAAQTITSLGTDLSDIAGKGALEEIPGIGKDLANKINEILKTGKLKFYEQLRDEIPEGLTLLMSVPGVGPKTAKLLYDKLDIKNLKDLEKAAKKHTISTLPGIKEKTEENILRGIALTKKAKERMTLAGAISISQGFIEPLKKLKEVRQIESAGSLRRKKETVRDIDILITSSKPLKIMDVFTGLPQVKEVQAKGTTKSSILTEEGVQVDVRVVQPKSFGAALLYFTGSKEHNIKLRQLAIKSGLKINEYGLFKKKKWIAGRKEEDLYRALKLPLIPAELREDRGEIERGLENKLPRLLTLKDIRGDLHVHSRWSDGDASIEDLVKAARRKGYKYIAICDHSQSIKIANGLSIERLKKQIDLIKKLNKKFKDIAILSGNEVDIKSDGSLDYPDKVLKQLDVVVAAIHTGFKQSRKQITERIIQAMRNKYVTTIAHPSGRLLGQREAYDVDMEKVLEVAAETGTFMEINSFPDRLDLIDINCRRAKELGVKMAIATDAHTLAHLDFMYLGVCVARRGWLEKENVVNTYSKDGIYKIIGKKRHNG
ncbi:MAG: DNA polymerase/3'-5' exonuclease PolX [Candidatus Omnitrophica bacterium]|nr:DNA polymerase/3'-5' exonuclease PolX [Candidatus Omnitrophota bacterium]